MKNNRSVLVIGIATGIGLTIIRSLGAKGIKVYGIAKNKTDIGIYSKYLTKKFIIPFNIQDNEEKFIDRLLRILTEYRIGYVMTISENFMIALNKNREKIEKFSKLLIPESDILDIVLDKGKTMMVAEQLKIPIPKTIFFKDLDQLSDCNRLNFPVIIKPASRNFHNPEQRKLDFKYKYFDKYECLYEYLSKNFSKFQAHHFHLLIQERCLGEEIGFPLIMKNGKCVASFQYRVLNMPPNGGVSVYQESLEINPLLMKNSVNILRAINFEGVAELDYIHDERDDEFKLLEINGRFWGALAAAVKSGIDFPYILYQSFENPDELKTYNYRSGVRCRILGGHTNSILQTLFLKKTNNQTKLIRSKLKSLLEYIKSFHPSVKDHIQSIDDPLPGIMDILLIFSKPLRTAHQLLKKH